MFRSKPIEITIIDDITKRIVHILKNERIIPEESQFLELIFSFQTLFVTIPE